MAIKRASRQSKGSRSARLVAFEHSVLQQYEYFTQIRRLTPVRYENRERAQAGPATRKKRACMKFRLDTLFQTRIQRSSKRRGASASRVLQHRCTRNSLLRPSLVLRSSSFFSSFFLIFAGTCSVGCLLAARVHTFLSKTVNVNSLFPRGKGVVAAPSQSRLFVGIYIQQYIYIIPCTSMYTDGYQL